MCRFASLLLVTIGVIGCTSRSGSKMPGDAPDAPEMTTTAPSIRVVVTDGKLTIDDQIIALPCPVESVTNLFGEPSRTLGPVNVVHVWDESGVFAYMSPDQRNVDSLAFAFDRFDADHWPKTLFNGQLSIDDRALSQSTTNRDLTNAGYGNYGIILWFRQSGNLGVDVQTNDTNVVSVSLAPES